MATSTAIIFLLFILFEHTHNYWTILWQATCLRVIRTCNHGRTRQNIKKNMRKIKRKNMRDCSICVKKWNHIICQTSKFWIPTAIFVVRFYIPLNIIKDCTYNFFTNANSWLPSDFRWIYYTRTKFILFIRGDRYMI